MPGLSDTVAAAVAEYRVAGGAEDPAVVVRSPGRVNVLGEHTDYNDGLCLPAAIDREVVVAADAGGGVLSLASAGHEPAAPFPVGAPPAHPPWARLAGAVAAELAALGRPFTGLTAGVAGNLPEGAGLSSSAAFEVGLAVALAATAHWEVPPLDVAAACRRAELAGLGVACGPMDQVAVACGRAGHALLLDCETLEVEPVRLPAGVALVVIDSGIARTLAGSGYNARRAECQEAARLLRVASLRRLGPDDLPRVEAALPAVLAARVRHVVTENARVRAAVTADAPALGALLNASHRSLAVDYEVSLPDVDRLVAATVATEGVFGARLTGAGFGGAIVAVADAGLARAAADDAAARYESETGRRARPLVVTPAEGASLLDGGLRPPSNTPLPRRGRRPSHTPFRPGGARPCE